MSSMFERPVVFKFTIGSRVGVKKNTRLRATGCTEKSYALTYPEGFMVVDLVYGIHGPDYHCEPISPQPHARVMWIDEKYLEELDTVK